MSYCNPVDYQIFKAIRIVGIMNLSAYGVSLLIGYWDLKIVRLLLLIIILFSLVSGIGLIVTSFIRILLHARKNKVS